MQYSITFIIRYLNDKQNIARCVKSIQNQISERNSFEFRIIIINKSFSMRGKRILTKLEEDYRVNILTGVDENFKYELLNHILLNGFVIKLDPNDIVKPYLISYLNSVCSANHDIDLIKILGDFKGKNKKKYDEIFNFSEFASSPTVGRETLSMMMSSNTDIYMDELYAIRYDLLMKVYLSDEMPYEIVDNLPFITSIIYNAKNVMYVSTKCITIDVDNNFISKLGKDLEDEILDKAIELKNSVDNSLKFIKNIKAINNSEKIIAKNYFEKLYYNRISYLFKISKELYFKIKIKEICKKIKSIFK